ncbi:MAG: TetR/AcrR family transcriptional regulator [Devosia sp.]|uniref:TetR/AcrR family transcriptional regulator n=1 Tax=Devosia sp. TaxID=1871048 RepID=UPI001AC60739|nr:TetR/AcrR family transcriptional regulator [Devosia sp.]MBN9316448.1 TetR/AcrR family transcriptional regulator [Devosia sp.]
MPNEPDRRTQILDAALACFLDRGYAATSIADIRAGSGASTGSIYHFFSNKGALASALVERAVAGWGAATAAIQPGMPAEAAIRASVSGLVIWGLERPAERRFLDEMRSLARLDPTLADVDQYFARGALAASALYAEYRERGEVRDLPWPVAHALMLGPAYDFLRHADPAEAPAQAAALLADAAWDAVRLQGT